MLWAFLRISLVLGISALSAFPQKPAAAATRGVKVAELDPELTKRAGKYYALVIGNNDYKQWPKLHTAVRDAEQVAGVLAQRYGFEVELLRDATREQMSRSLAKYKNFDEGANLLVYYAGHGYYDKTGERTYWIPVDGDKNDDPTNWLATEDITTALKKMPARHVLVIADSCYSGTMRAGKGVGSPQDKRTYIEKLGAKRSRTLMASGGNEPVADGGGEGHSIFARSLLNGLETMPDEAFAAKHLYDEFIEVNVGGRARQTPQYRDLPAAIDEDGDFIFYRTPRQGLPAALGTSAASGTQQFPVTSRVPPSSPAASLFNRGQLALEEKRYDEAAVDLKDALAQEPANPVYLRSFGHANYFLRRYQEAEKAYRDSLRATPDAQTWNWLGVTLRELGRSADAEEAYRAAVKVNPNFYWGHANLSSAYRLRNEFVAAEQEARRAIAIDPNGAFAYEQLSLALLAQQKYADAEVGSQKAISIDPKNFGYYNMLGNAQAGLKRHQEAAASYRKAISLAPAEPWPHINLCSALQVLREYSDAETEAREGERINPNLANAKNCLGNALFGQKKYAESVTAYRRALILEPNNAVFHDNLAGSLRELARYQESELAAREAVRLAPRNSQFHRSLGIALFRQDNFAAALQEFQQALQLDPAYPVNYSNLADTLLRLKRPAEAIPLLRKASELDPPNQVFKDMLLKAEAQAAAQ